MPSLRTALLVTHPIFRRPAFGRQHPLATGRDRAVLELIEAMGWVRPELVREAPLADRAALERFHAPHYLDAFETAARAQSASPELRARYHLGTMECPLFEGLWERARATVGGAMLAAELALQGHVVFHPAGGTHHGTPERASGFCYLNDPVFAILRLLDAGLERIAYVDLDAHHGDGVEAAFAREPRVALVSIHEEGRWPHTGRIADACGGRAWNIPVPRGLTDAEFALLVETVVLPVVRAWSDAVVITCGADPLDGDPLSAMRLTNGALIEAVECCVAAASRAVVLGGGGYNPWTTARLWAALWARLAGYAIPERLPRPARSILAALDCDLVESEERDPRWRTTLLDPPGDGTIRPRIRELAALLARRPTTSKGHD
jgi:acetoin utilization protein AcuC